MCIKCSFIHVAGIYTLRSARSKVINMQSMSPPFIKQTYTQRVQQRTFCKVRVLKSRTTLENSKANKHAGMAASINMYTFHKQFNVESYAEIISYEKMKKKSKGRDEDEASHTRPFHSI